MEDFEGAESIARALCLIAAGVHSKDPRNQEDIAKCFYQWAEDGDEMFKPDEALVQHLAKAMGIDPKRLKRAP